MIQRYRSLIDELAQIEGKAEIVDGEILLMSPANTKHSDEASEIAYSLRALMKAPGGGVGVGDNMGFLVDLPRRQSFSPDAAWIHTDRRAATAARCSARRRCWPWRLVERGVRFVNVSWDNFSKRFKVSQAAWDTHENNFPMLKKTLLPDFDETYSALMEDLDARGLLDETLVVTMGEIGRTPKINGKGGRDHWTFCYSVLFGGAGIQGGAVHGASDQQAAFIQDKPVHIRDVVATIYHLLGIDPEMPVYDRARRPTAVAHGGRPVREILS